MLLQGYFLINFRGIIMKKFAVGIKRSNGCVYVKDDNEMFDTEQQAIEEATNWVTANTGLKVVVVAVLKIIKIKSVPVIIETVKL